jgi:hypothetical protein
MRGSEREHVQHDGLGGEHDRAERPGQQDERQEQDEPDDPRERREQHVLEVQVDGR